MRDIITAGPIIVHYLMPHHETRLTPNFAPHHATRQMHQEFVPPQPSMCFVLIKERIGSERLMQTDRFSDVTPRDYPRFTYQVDK